MSKARLLITNDDGFDAPGILALVEALRDDYDCYLVAPMENQSCKGVSIALPSKLEAAQISVEGAVAAWKVKSTPADCVKFALHYVLEKKPDLVLSGINNGWNAGRNVFYSGTIGATIQASFYHLPAIAFSSYPWLDAHDFTLEKGVVQKLTAHFLKTPIGKGSVMNVNFPAPKKKVLGLKMARQGLSFWNPVVRARGSAPDFYLDESIEYSEEDPESDIYLLSQGYVTCTPLQVNDLTDYGRFEQMKISFLKADLHQSVLQPEF